MRENVGFTESLLKPKKSSRILQDNAFTLDIEFYTCAHKVSIGQYMRALIKKPVSLATFNSTFSQTGFEKLPNHINMSEETRDWEFPLTKVTATYVRKTENSQYCVVVYWIIWRAPIIRKSDLGLQSFCIAHCQLAHMGHFLITCQTT